MTPILLGLGALGVGGLGYLAYRKSQGLPLIPRSSSQPSAYQRPADWVPLLTPTVTGIQPGQTLLVNTQQPNLSEASMTVTVDQVLGGGMYAVHGRPDIDKYEASWGLVYPTKVGDGDIVYRVDESGNQISGMRPGGVGLNPQPLPPGGRMPGKNYKIDALDRYHARQSQLKARLR